MRVGNYYKKRNLEAQSHRLASIDDSTYNDGIIIEEMENTQMFSNVDKNSRSSPKLQQHTLNTASSVIDESCIEKVNNNFSPNDDGRVIDNLTQDFITQSQPILNNHSLYNSSSIRLMQNNFNDEHGGYAYTTKNSIAKLSMANKPEQKYCDRRKTYFRYNMLLNKLNLNGPIVVFN